MSKFHKVIGIDLGTTFSVVAAYDSDKQDVVVIPNRQNERTTPSVVHVSSQGRFSVGQAAREKLGRDPDGVIIEVKRIMGETDGGRKRLAQGANRQFDPEQISAAILRELKISAERMIGAPIHDAVITVPAYFKEPQKNATCEAARIARLNPRLIINEPTAAAVAYGLESGEEAKLAVYDLGGGTFDVSVVHVKEGNEVEILGTGGDANLGGGDIDEQIVQWVLGEMEREHGRSFRGNAKLVGRLRLEAEKVKINLCNQSVPQEFYVTAPEPGIDEVSYELDMERFARMVTPLLEKTFVQVDVALASAAKGGDFDVDDLDAFILVGGSSKIPIVAEMLEKRYGKPVRTDLNPDEIVAMGAARVACDYPPSKAVEIREDKPLELDREDVPMGELTDTHIKDVVSHTLGVGLKDDVYDPLIPKDTIIPERVQRSGYTTAEDNQTNIFVPIYQGDDTKGSLNHKIGQVIISGLTPEPKGKHQFEITFALDVNGRFAGEVKHLQTGRVEPVKLDRGDLELTHKQRVELGEELERGEMKGKPTEAGAAGGAAAAPPAGDPIAALIQKATDMLPSLPGDRQQEVSDYLSRLRAARASNDAARQGQLIAELTMLIMRYQV